MSFLEKLGALKSVMGVILALFVLTLLWGVRQMWKVNNKFLAVLFLVLAGVVGYVGWMFFLQ